MFFEPRDYLRDILVEADYLIGQAGGLTFEEFVGKETLQRAFVRSLEIIWEAAKKVLCPRGVSDRRSSVNRYDGQLGVDGASQMLVATFKGGGIAPRRSSRCCRADSQGSPPTPRSRS